MSYLGKHILSRTQTLLSMLVEIIISQQNYCSLPERLYSLWGCRDFNMLRMFSFPPARGVGRPTSKRDLDTVK